MQVLRPDGSYGSVSHRSWPLAGTSYQQEYTQSWAGLRLSALPTGESRILSYRRIYRGNPWVWASVNAIAQGLAGFPLRVYGWGKDGERIPFRDELPQGRPGPAGAALGLAHLLAHPAPFISRRRTVRRAAVDKLVYGSGIWAKEPDGYGGVEAIYNVPWREIAVIEGRDTPIVGYRVMGTAGTKVWAQDDVVQFGEGDPDGPIAPSPLESLQWTIALMDAMSRNIVAFFQNGVRTSGVLKLESMPDDRELAILREQITQLYSGNENAGRPLITSGTWSPMSTGFNYSDVVELSRLSREEVAAAYHVPPPVMGILDKTIKPLDPNAEIRRADGTLSRLIDLEVGSEILTHTGAKAKVLRNVDAGRQRRLKLTTRRGREIIAAPDHPFLTTRGWAYLADLCPGDGLVEEPPVEGGGDEITSAEARLLGYFVGDGAVGPSGTTINACFTNADEAIVADFEASCHRQGWATSRAGQYGYRASGGVRDWLRFHGLAGKVSATKRIPDSVLRSGAWIRAEFLAAYFDCDGCVFIRKGKGSHHRVFFSTISRGLADDTLHLLHSLKIGARIRPHRSRGERIAWSVDVDGPDWERFAGLIRPVGAKRRRLEQLGQTSRRQVAADAVPGEKPCSVDGCTRPVWAKDLCNTDYAMARRHGRPMPGPTALGDSVVSIEELKPGPVRCIEIDHPDHSYMANGVVTHNSTLAELREQFTRETLNEYASEMSDEIDAQLIEPAPQWSGLNAGFDMSGNLMPDLEALSTAFKELKRVFTLNELRRMAGLPDLPFEWANQPWMEPGSLPAGLAPQGATVNPDEPGATDVDPDDPQPAPGDDEVEDGKGVEENIDVSSVRRRHVVSSYPMLQRAILAG